MSQNPASLGEPIEIEKFWKTRRRDIAIVVTLSTYEGTNIVNIREFFTGSDGCMKPSTRGLAMAVRRLPELSNAVRKALERARSLGLLPEEGAE
jgi:hypothetical protein